MQEKISPGYKQSEIGVIPEDWAVKPLSELTDPERPIGYGIVQTGPSVLNGIPCVRVLDLVDGRISRSNLITTSKEISLSYKRTLLREGDLVIALRGKVGALAKVDAALQGANLTRGVALLSKYTRYVPEYLLQYLSSSIGQALIEKNFNGSALQEIPIASLRKLPIAVPADAEQRAIAEALSDADARIAALEALIAKKRDIKQAAMQQLLTGKTRLPGFSGEWEVKPLGDLISAIGDGGTPATSNLQNFGGGVHWVVIDDIKPEIWTTKNSLSEAGLARCSAKLWPAGTLILSTGATIGEVGVARIPVATKQGICGIVFDPRSAHVQFMKYWFSLNRPLLLSKAQGSTIFEVRPPTLVKIEGLFPEIVEQTAIAEILSDMDAELAALEAEVEKAHTIKQGMMQNLLTGKVRLV